MTRKATLTEAIDKGVHNKLKGVNTAIPGHVLSFDINTQLIEVQIAIERVDINGNSEKLSPIISVPVHFPGCSYAVEYQIDIGSEGLVIFSQRCIDAWLDQGGVAPQSRIQFHNLNDAMFIPGIRSQPKKLQGFQNNGVRLRNQNGSEFIWLKNDSTAEITVTTLKINGNIEHNGNTEQIGNTTSTGTIESPAMNALNSLTVDGMEQKDHGHLPGTYNISGTPVTGNSGTQS